MSIDRRALLGAMGGLAASRVLGLSTPDRETDSASTPSPLPDLQRAALPTPNASFPRTDDFVLEPGVTFLNAAYTHPVPKVAVQAAQRGAQWRGTMRATMDVPAAPSPKELFATLINAKPSEIAHVSSTSAGENLVMRALQLDHRFDGNVVSDGLHFEGALMHLDALRKRGLDVRVVQPTADARIDLTALERRIDKRTRLVQISATASYNGFQHDLKAIAALAHAHGALVYVDIVHAAGAEPLDMQTCDVDFAASTPANERGIA
jgi:selenocysteine lyase/cysteine desulfurase